LKWLYSSFSPQVKNYLMPSPKNYTPEIFPKIPATTVCQSAKFIGTSEHPLPLARGMISSEVKAEG
jgi:hypothetical protein